MGLVQGELADVDPLRSDLAVDCGKERSDGFGRFGCDALSIALSGDWSAFRLLLHCLFDEAGPELSQLGELSPPLTLSLAGSFDQAPMPRRRQ